MAKKGDDGEGVMGCPTDGGTTANGWSVKFSQIHDASGTFLLAENEAEKRHLGSLYAVTGADLLQMALDNGQITVHGIYFSNYAFCDGHVALVQFPKTKSPNMWTRKSGD